MPQEAGVSKKAPMRRNDLKLSGSGRLGMKVYWDGATKSANTIGILIP